MKGLGGGMDWGYGHRIGKTGGKDVYLDDPSGRNYQKREKEKKRRSSKFEMVQFFFVVRNYDLCFIILNFRFNKY